MPPIQLDKNCEVRPVVFGEQPAGLVDDPFQLAGRLPAMLCGSSDSQLAGGSPGESPTAGRSCRRRGRGSGSAFSRSPSRAIARIVLGLAAMIVPRSR